MKNKILKFIFIVSLIFSSQSFSQSIKKIEFIGLNVYPESTLLSILEPINLSEFNETTSNNLIKILFQTGFFSNISISETDENIQISVNENPIIRYFDFDNNEQSGFANWFTMEEQLFSSELLNNLADENNLSPGNILTDLKISSFKTLVESKYLDAGFYNIDINNKVTIDSQNRAGITFIINQGKRAKITNLSIIGASNISEDKLLNNFSIGEADFFIMNYFTNNDEYSENEFIKGLESITNLYFDSGYLDFKVTGVDKSLNSNNEELSIIISISEGVKYKLGNISIEGELGNQTEESLISILNLKSGEIFNRNSIISDIQKITDLYADQGYAFVDINPITSDFLDTINISYIISLNKKVYVNRINIQGNTRTQDEVIRREIGIAEGGLYSRSALRKSILKLRRLGYFSDVQMEATEIINMPDKINLTFVVEETQTGSVSFSVSHSNNYGISVGAGIQEKNIFGSGNTFNADFKVSESFNKISFYFKNPNFNELNHSISIGAFVSELKDNDVVQNSYEVNTKGLSLGYGIPLKEDTRIEASLEFSQNEVKCGALFLTSNYESSQCASSTNDEFKLSANWNENTLNAFMYPTDGASNSISAGIALPIGDYRYFNIGASHQSYEPINDNLTLKLTGDLKIASGYNNKELPFFKRYFGGGSGSVRGFGNKTLGPIYPNGKSKGGEVSILGSANLITPAFFFENNENMRMSAFIDAGNIFEKSSNIQLEDIRISAGLGFAYLSPIGAIGIFASTPILKKDGDIIEEFGFSLGTGF
jgi:outer membrane protein insertion porin family